MAKSNFNYIYQTLPNLFFKTDDEVLETANCIYPGDEQKQDEYIQRVYEGQRVLDECEIKDLKSFIKKLMKQSAARVKNYIIALCVHVTKEKATHL